MATKTEIRLIDDLDGGNADESVKFSLDGIDYNIDLNEDNAKKLRNDLAVYIGHAQRVGGKRTSSKNGSSNGTGLPTAEIREWAKANHIDVNERGRIPQSVIDAWEKRAS